MQAKRQKEIEILEQKQESTIEETDSSSSDASSQEPEEGKPKRYSTKYVFKKHKVMGKQTQNCKELCVEGRTKGPMQFKVLNYNVLADSYHQIRKIKKLCAMFPNRFPKVQKEIKLSNADLVLLQEVDH